MCISNLFVYFYSVEFIDLNRSYVFNLFGTKIGDKRDARDWPSNACNKDKHTAVQKKSKTGCAEKIKKRRFGTNKVNVWTVARASSEQPFVQTSDGCLFLLLLLLLLLQWKPRVLRNNPVQLPPRLIRKKCLSFILTSIVCECVCLCARRWIKMLRKKELIVEGWTLRKKAN